MDFLNLNENDFDFLLEKIQTKEDVLSLIEEISGLQNTIFKNQGGKNGIFKKEIYDSDLKKRVIKMEGGEMKNQKEILSFLEELKTRALSLPSIRLKFAFRPSGEFLKKTGSWLKKETGKKIILETIVDQKIIGGLILEYSGKYADFSLRKKLENPVILGDSQ